VGSVRPQSDNKAVQYSLSYMLSHLISLSGMSKC
jgi:hypothetical protein